MATPIERSSATDDASLFLKIAIGMAVTVFAGFGFNLAMARSSFGAPPVIHMHAVVFMGWVVIYVLQNWLVASGRMALHRRLGWIAVAWLALMAWFGIAVTVAVVQRGTTPFFFLPQHFLIANPLGLFAFVALVLAAVANRRRTDWHRRLQLCAMATIMGPAFGRLLPMPFMTPYAFEAATLAGLIFPAIAMWRESRTGVVHPAWKWGILPTPITLLLALALSQTAVGDSLYQWVTAGTPGAAVAPLEYGTPPPGMM
jgi:hypothetical protein